MTPDEIKQLEARLTQMRAEVAAKAAQDADFHDALKAAPQDTLEKAYGLPPGTFDGMKIAIFEEPAGTLGFVIPSRGVAASNELTEEQLEAVAGGSYPPGFVAGNPYGAYPGSQIPTNLVSHNPTGPYYGQWGPMGLGGR